MKQKNIPKVVELQNNQEPLTNTTQKDKYDNSKNNVKGSFENSPEEKIKKQETPKIAECHKKPEPLINTTEKFVEIKINSDHKTNDPKETFENTKQETKDSNEDKQEDNRDTNKNNKIKKSEENYNEIKHTHPEDNIKNPTKTKIVKTIDKTKTKSIKNNQLEITTAIATKKIKPTSEIILEAMKQGTKISQEHRNKIIKEMKIKKPTSRKHRKTQKSF